MGVIGRKISLLYFAEFAVQAYLLWGKVGKFFFRTSDLDHCAAVMFILIVYIDVSMAVHSNVTSNVPPRRSKSRRESKQNFWAVLDIYCIMQYILPCDLFPNRVETGRAKM